MNFNLNKIRELFSNESSMTLHDVCNTSETQGCQKGSKNDGNDREHRSTHWSIYSTDEQIAVRL